MKVPLGSPMKVALRLEGEAIKSTLEPPPLMAAAVPESTLLPDSAVPPEGRKHASRERAAGQVPLQTTGASRVGCAPRHMQSILDETGFGMWVEQSTAGRSARAWQGAFLLRGCCGKCSKVGRLGPAVTMEHRIIRDATQPIDRMAWRCPQLLSWARGRRKTKPVGNILRPAAKLGDLAQGLWKWCAILGSNQ
jgi:hypothetical protein